MSLADLQTGLACVLMLAVWLGTAIRAHEARQRSHEGDDD